MTFDFRLVNLKIPSKKLTFAHKLGGRIEDKDNIYTCKNWSSIETTDINHDLSL